MTNEQQHALDALQYALQRVHEVFGGDAYASATLPLEAYETAPAEYRQVPSDHRSKNGEPFIQRVSERLRLFCADEAAYREAYPEYRCVDAA